MDYDIFKIYMKGQEWHDWGNGLGVNHFLHEVSES